MTKSMATLAIVTLLAACGPKPTATPTAAATDPDRPEKVCARQEVIYYGFNKPAIGYEAEQVLQASAKHIAECGATRITLVGHADTAEPEPDVVSKERTDLVAQRLRALGVTAEIQARNAGSNELAIQTDPGVKEPQNRRVTIDY